MRFDVTFSAPDDRQPIGIIGQGVLEFRPEGVVAAGTTPVSMTGQGAVLFVSTIALLFASVPLCNLLVGEPVLGLAPPALLALFGFRWLKKRAARLSAASTEPLELECAWGEVRELKPVELGWALRVGSKFLYFRLMQGTNASLVSDFESRRAR